MSTSVRRLVAVAAVVAALLAVAGTAMKVVPARADDAPRPIKVAPLVVRVGEPITVTGAGCTVDGEPGMAVAGLDNVPKGDLFGSADAREDGTWTVTIPGEAQLPPNTYPVVAVCWVKSSSTTIEYDHASVTVTPKRLPLCSWLRLPHCTRAQPSGTR